MAFLLLLFVLISSAACAPQLTPTQQKMVQLWGGNIDIPRSENIVREEASIAGISLDALLDVCAANAPLQLSDQDHQKMINELISLRKTHVTLNYKDQVLQELANRAPTTYTFFTKLFGFIEQNLAKVDANAQKFMRNFEDLLLESLVSFSKSTTGDEFLGNYIEEYAQMLKMYFSLPIASMGALERTYCFYTEVRILADNKIPSKFTAALAEAHDLTSNRK